MKTLIPGNVFRIYFSGVRERTGQYLGQSPEWPYTLDFREVRIKFNGYDAVEVFLHRDDQTIRIPPEQPVLLTWIAGNTVEV